MRLLNARSGKIEVFAGGSPLPRYAVLSHTWGPEEISLQEWTSLARPALHGKQGYFKIKCARQQALQDGLDYVWVDTCCIDKRSTTETEEAANSSFRWYEASAVCYAHLEDIAQPVLGASLADALRRSRWFTRGWTLSELIAPPEVVFFSTGWEALGSKTGLSAVISGFTGIDAAFLQGLQQQQRPPPGAGNRSSGVGVGVAAARRRRSKRSMLASLSVSRRMSWAAGRKTSRPEDVAYCLLGLFDVNMPLLYGEGRTRAFHRLQEEIMRANPMDHTLFAWGRAGAVVRERSDLIPQAVLMDEINTFPFATEAEPLLGLLAPSPDEFKGAADLVPMPAAAEFYYYNSEGVGNGKSSGPVPPHPSGGRGCVLADLPLLDPEAVLYQDAALQVAQLRWGRLAVLFCHRKGDPYEQLAVPLTPSGPASYGRTRELVAGNFTEHIWQTGGSTGAPGGASRVLVRPEEEDEGTPGLMSGQALPGHGDLVVRRWVVGNNEELITGEFRDGRSGHVFSQREGLLRVNGQTSGALLWSISTLTETETLCTFIKRGGTAGISSARSSYGGYGGGLLSSAASVAPSVINTAGAQGRGQGYGPNQGQGQGQDQGQGQGNSLGACSIEFWPLSRRVTHETVDAQGTTWFPLGDNEHEVLALAEREALYKHVFKPTSDTWLSPAVGALLPMVTARMDRIWIADDVAVDVVDVVAPYPPGGPGTTPELGGFGLDGNNAGFQAPQRGGGYGGFSN